MKLVTKIEQIVTKPRQTQHTCWQVTRSARFHAAQRTATMRSIFP